MVSQPCSKKRSSSAVGATGAKDRKRAGANGKTDTRSEPAQSVPKPKGLANIGHSCYVSCILQLLHASPVPAIFLNCGLGHLLNTVDGVSSTKLKMLQQLDAVVQAMHREPTVMPAGMVAAVCEITGLPQHSMQDAHECWMAFADCLDSVVLDESSPGECRFDPCGGAQGANTLGKYCFGSLVRSTLQCKECGHVSWRNETCLDLQVPLPASSNSNTSCCKAEPIAACLAAVADDTSGRSSPNDAKPQPSGSGEVVQDPASRTTSGGVSNSADTSTVDHVPRLNNSRQSTPTAAVPRNGVSDAPSAPTRKADGNDLSPDLVSVDLEDALQMVFSEEVIEGFRCEGCGKVPGASKRLSIEQLPRSLVIQVKRFQQDVKLRGHVACPLDLNMLRFSSAAMEARGTLDARQGSLTGADEEVLQQLHAAQAGLYHLKVVVEHRGRGLNSGHFVAYVLMGSRWFLCNDKSVNEKGTGTELPDVAPGYGKKSTLVHQQKTWEATGVVSLRDSKLRELPKGIDRIAERVTTVDVSNNMLDSMPVSLTALSRIERLVMANNNISSVLCDMTTWRKLRMLDLACNALTEFPGAVCSCTALEILKFSHNSIPSIPAELANCLRLRELHMSNNSVQHIPDEVAACASLELIDLNANKLSEIPLTLGRLAKLRRLLLNNNQQLAAVPREVLKDCELLHTLELHGTQVTREILQQTEGYEAFEKRRQNKFSKAIDGNAMMREGGVDEGIDVVLK